MVFTKYKTRYLVRGQLYRLPIESPLLPNRISNAYSLWGRPPRGLAEDQPLCRATAAAAVGPVSVTAAPAAGPGGGGAGGGWDRLGGDIHWEDNKEE